MKINEVEKKLGVTKDALRYYEKEKLVLPARDTNGYRSYCQDDIRIIKNIMMLRSLDISIDEIKAIFNNELTINDCLENKEQSLIKEVNKKTKIIKQIQMNLVRKKAYFAYQEIPEDLKNEYFVLFKDQQVVLKEPCLDNEVVYRYEDIEKITFSLCSRTYLPELVADQGYAVCRGRPHYGLLSHYYVDLDIYCHGGKYEFESISLDNISNIFSILEINNVTVEDDIGLKAIFKKFTNSYQLNRYIDNNIRKWQKKYDLDNPRGTEILEQTNQFHNYIVNNGKAGRLDCLFLLKRLIAPYPRLYHIILLIVLGVPLFVIALHLIIGLFF